MIKLKSNIQESSKVKKFLGVYYKWDHNDEVLHKKMTMEKDIKKLVDGYEKFTGSGVKVQKMSGYLSTNPCKIKTK